MLPREKLQKRGVSVLSDLELVEVLVGSGVRGRDFKQISRAIMNSIQKKVKDNKYLDLSDLVKIEGVGDVVAMRVLCGIELGKRIYVILVLVLVLFLMSFRRKLCMKLVLVKWRTLMWLYTLLIERQYVQLAL